MTKDTYTVIGGNPFVAYTGTTTFPSLRVVGITDSFEDMKKTVKDEYDNCGGLMLVLKNGKEIEYDGEGNFKEP